VGPGALFAPIYREKVFISCHDRPLLKDTCYITRDRRIALYEAFL